MAVVGFLLVCVQAFAVPADAQVLPSPGSFNQVDTVIEVQPSGELVVTETFDVTFLESRRGIFREIPIVYRTKIGDRMKLEAEVESVLQDDASAVTDIYEQGDNLVIRIGNPVIYLVGDHTYQITYTLQDAVLFFDTYDEIYLNTMQTGGDLALGDFTATVKLPGGAEVIQFSCYSGAFGSTEQNCTTTRGEDGSIRFEHTGPFTFAVGFTKGIIPEPTLKQRIAELILENLFAGIAVFPALFAFGLWSAYGKDDEIGTIVTEFSPAPGLSPAQHGRIAEFSFNKHTVASMVIFLAVSGYLKIVQTGDDVQLFKLKPAGDDLDEDHKTFLNELFKKGDMLPMNDFGKVFAPSVMSSIKASLDRFHDKTLLTSSSRVWQALVVGFAIFMGFIALDVIISYGIVNTVATLMSAVVVAIFGVLMTKKSPEGIQTYRRVKGFQDFIHTAERFKARWAEKEHLFENYLPYAIAFHDTDHWASVFKNYRLENVSWYQGPDMLDVLILASLTDSLGSSMQSAVSKATESSASSGGSGSGGGGFSGGGFGGGGGGSW